MTVEGACLVERPIMVSNFEDTFRAGECGDAGVHQGCVGFAGSE